MNNVQLLFDGGSQRSYISEDLRKKLNLSTLRKENIAINTFGNKENQSIDVVPVKFILKDRVLEIDLLSTSFIYAEILHKNVKKVSSTYSHLENLVVVDSSSNRNKNIDILIGAENYYRLYLEMLFVEMLTSPLQWS